ncbi:MAG: PP2C family protein-serine/threonine phosphatase [Paracoccaceae bacterium]
MNSPDTVVPPARPLLPVIAGAGLTHRGMVRDRNEDAILTDPSGRLWAVADGMGGYGHGDVASDLVIDCIETIRDDEPPLPALTGRLAEANSRVLAKAAEPGMGRMGATVVALIVAGARAHLAWAGDSRAYLFRGGRLRLLTRDHTVVQDLVESGSLSAEAAEDHPDSHIVTRAVGGDAELEPDTAEVPLLAGDRLLLCSDGLTRALYESAVEGALGAGDDPVRTCEALVRESLANGAPDNVSVIVVDLNET